jgi:hypothetical protein
MITFVTGEKGCGKSTFGTEQLVEELRRTRRPIVTSLAIELDPWVDETGKAPCGLLKGLHQKFGDTFDAERRIFLLDEEGVKRFFACRPLIPREDFRPRKVKWLKQVGEGPNSRFVLEKWAHGCCYIIDEVQETFKASTWRALEGETSGWAAAERRAGDEAWLLTQVLGNVAKPLRVQGNRLYYLVNHGHKQWFKFHMPRRITWAMYSSVENYGAEQAVDYGTLKYDRVWLQSLYNTSRGHGVVQTQAADIGRVAPGFSIWWIPVGGFVGCVLLGFMLHYGFIALNFGSRKVIGNVLGSPGRTKPVSALSAGLARRVGFEPTNNVQYVSQPRSLPAEVKIPVRHLPVEKYSSWSVLTDSRGSQIWTVKTDLGATVFGKHGERIGSTIILDGVEYQFSPRK